MLERTRLATLSLLTLLTGVHGCAPQAAEDEPTRRVASAIIDGTGSDASEDAVVLLVAYEPGASRLEICTATLIAPRLLLTARHCVARTDLNVACTSEGAATKGGDIGENRDPGDLLVFTGSERPLLDPQRWRPATTGLEIVDDGGTNLCNRDIALVVLKDAITGIDVAPIRLGGDVASGEKLKAVGWGITSSGTEPTARQRRAGVTVTRTGPSETPPPLGANEFLFDESICLGDSGGPLFAESTGAVVGVASRGGNGAVPNGAASTCFDAQNLATKTSGFEDLVRRGFARAGAEPKVEERDDDGCAVSRRARADDGVLVALGLVALVIRGRRSSRGSSRR